MAAQLPALVSEAPGAERRDGAELQGYTIPGLPLGAGSAAEVAALGDLLPLCGVSWAVERHCD